MSARVLQIGLQDRLCGGEAEKRFALFRREPEPDQRCPGPPVTGSPCRGSRGVAGSPMRRHASDPRGTARADYYCLAASCFRWCCYCWTTRSRRARRAAARARGHAADSCDAFYRGIRYMSRLLLAGAIRSATPPTPPAASRATKSAPRGARRTSWRVPHARPSGNPRKWPCGICSSRQPAAPCQC